MMFRIRNLSSGFTAPFLLALLFSSLLIILSISYLDVPPSEKPLLQESFNLSDELEYVLMEDNPTDGSELVGIDFSDYVFQDFDSASRNRSRSEWSLLRFKLPAKNNLGKVVVYFENSCLNNAVIYLPYRNQDLVSYKPDKMIDNYFTLYSALPDDISRKDYLYIQIDSSCYGCDLIMSELSIYSRNQSLIFYYIVVNIGITFSMIIANLCLFLNLKETLYLLHALFLLSFLHFIMALSGIFKLFNIFYTADGISYWASMTFLSLAVFFYFLLEINNRSRKYRVLFNILIAVSLFSFVINRLSTDPQILKYLLPGFAIVLLLSLFACTFYIHFKCKVFTNYIMAALSIMGASGIIMTCALLDLISVNIYIDNIAVLGISIESFLFTMGIARKIKCAYLKIEKLKKLSSTDKLTKLYNRSHFDKVYMSFLSYSERYQESLSVVLLDIDHFKQVNDTFGHHNGDLVLKRTAELLHSSLRNSDVAFRWGGEEFMILLPHTDIAGASHIAEQMRGKIETDSFGDICRVTASFGVIEIDEDETYEEWFSRLDVALYKAKNSGRNQVIPCFGCVNEEKIPLVRFEWLQTYECSHPIIDEQHRTLFDKINKILLAFQTEKSRDSILKDTDDLIEYIVSHFKDEEQILGCYGYGKLYQHIEIHKELIIAAQEFRERLALGKVDLQEIFSLVYGDIIMGHLVSEDFKFFSHLQKKLE